MCGLVVAPRGSKPWNDHVPSLTSGACATNALAPDQRELQFPSRCPCFPIGELLQYSRGIHGRAARHRSDPVVSTGSRLQLRLVSGSRAPQQSLTNPKSLSSDCDYCLGDVTSKYPEFHVPVDIESRLDALQLHELKVPRARLN